MFALGAAPGIILAVSMLTVSETPRWLVEHGHGQRARDVLTRTRGEGNVDEEIEEIEDVSRQQGRFALPDLLGARVRPMLLIGVLLAVFQQVLGINTVIYYGATILGFAGLSVSSSIAQAVFIGVVNLVFAGVAVLLLDRVGRRPMLITGTSGSVIGLIVLGWYFHTGAAFQHSHAWIALAAMMFYIASFEISLGPIFWVMIAEIFPLRARAKAMAVCTMANWAFNFLVSFFFLDAVSAMGESGTFFMYAGLGLVAVAFFTFRVPETKHRSLEQIEREIHGDSTRSLRPEARAPRRRADIGREHAPTH
jgi:sugar porter (SP) family MFS transporter